MKLFDVQSIQLNTRASQAFDYIADPTTLPEWTNAFAEVTVNGNTKEAKAQLQTPTGSVPIDLTVAANSAAGTVDWFMRFPDKSIATAFSRVVELAPEQCVYSFTLTPPPVPLEALEGALEQQSGILAEELATLKNRLENHA